MSTKTNVKIYSLISSLVCILLRMEKRSVRTFDKYILSRMNMYIEFNLLMFVNTRFSVSWENSKNGSIRNKW